MTADDVANVIAGACRGHHQVRSTRRVATIYRDRVGVQLVTVDGQAWRVHVLRDPPEATR